MFAIRIVKLARYLQEDKKEYILSKQLMRSGTSIGANVSESQQAQSRADFVSKLNFALKEAAETSCWLQLLNATEYLSTDEFESIYSDCREMEKAINCNYPFNKGKIIVNFEVKL